MNVLSFLRSKIENKIYNFHMYCDDYNYAKNNLTEELNDLEFEINIRSNRVLLSDPPQYEVSLKFI